MNRTALNAFTIIFSLLCVWMALTLPQETPVATTPTGKIPAEAPVAMTQQEPMPGVWYSVVMNVSAYCPCEACCGHLSPGITASGNRVEGPVKHWVAAPPEYAFGTVMRVPGYAGGRPVCVLDRGGDIKGDKLDVYFPTHQAARKFGRQKLTVEIWKGTEQ